MASISDQAKEDKLLLARIEDALHLSQTRHCSKFVGFLDERQGEMMRNRFSHNPFVLFYGGYPDAQRVFFGAFDAQPDTASFPIVSLCFEYRQQAHLTHRDFLGTFMSEGVRRETIGDILCKPGRAVALVDASVAPHLLSSVQRVGGEGVRVHSPFDGDWADFAAQKSDYRDTVASLRLDAVLHVMLRHSRTQACDLIRAGLVSVNHVVCTCVSRILDQGDVVSVKGKGRFVLEQVGAESKKGRLFITVSKFV